MPLLQWIRGSHPERRAGRVQKKRLLLRLEALEDRRLLTAFHGGDVLVSVSNGLVQHRDSGGALIENLDTTVGGFNTGMAFDSSNNLYVTDFSNGSVSKFDQNGSLIGPFGSGYISPESILFDAVGNAFVGDASINVIQKFDATGAPLAQYTVASEDRGTDWIDLSADQATLYYTSEGDNVLRFDTNTNTQLSNFTPTPLPGSAAYALRLLPTGGALVADSETIVRLDSSGAVIQSYDAPAEDSWFALNLDPDGTSFWSADFSTADVYKFDIDSGTVLLHFNTGTGSSTVFGLAVNGEITVAQKSLSISSVTQNEGNTGTAPFVFTVTLSAPSSQTVTVHYSTADDGAIAPQDYVAQTGDLTFAPGVTTQLITIAVVGDTTFEPDESFSINLSNATNATISTATGTGTILNDDAAVSVVVQTDLSHARQGGSTLPIMLQIFNGAGTNVSSPSLPVHVLGIGTSPDQPVGTLSPASDSGNSNPGGLFRNVDDAYVFNLKLVDASGKALKKGTYYLFFTIGDDPTVQTLSFMVK